jgi:hypothetical protein
MITGMPRDVALAISFASTPGCGLLEAMPVAPAAIAELNASLWEETSVWWNDVRTVTPRSLAAFAAPLWAMTQIWSPVSPCEIQ